MSVRPEEGANVADGPSTALSHDVPAPSKPGRTPILLPILGGALLSGLGFLIWSFLFFESRHDAFLSLTGVKLVVGPPTFDVGVGKNGEYRSATFSARNLTGRSVSIAGAASQCSCMATEGLPMEIPSHGSRPLTIKVHYEDKPGERFDRVITYYDEKVVRWGHRGVASPIESWNIRQRLDLNVGRVGRNVNGRSTVRDSVVRRFTRDSVRLGCAERTGRNQLHANT